MCYPSGYAVSFAGRERSEVKERFSGHDAARARMRGRRGELIFKAAAAFASAALVGLVFFMVFELATRSIPSLQQFGFSFLTGTTWNPVKDQFSGLTAVFGTLVTAVLAIIIAVPVSIGAAIFLSELAPHGVRGVVSFLVELLAAVPSVVYGLWALFVLVPFVVKPVETLLEAHLGFFPLFKGPIYGGVGILAAGVILAIMILPIITATARDIIRMVPDSQKEAMLALGATRWETIWRAVLPFTRSGITGAVILGLGRALGETMAVTMVIGNAFGISPSIFAPGHSMASQIASEFPEASGGLYISSLIELGLLLLVISLAVNVLARLLVWRSTAGARAGVVV